MALSSWATVAFNEKGECCSAVLESFSKKYIAAIRKNYIALYREGKEQPIRIQFGSINIDDIHIFSERREKDDWALLFFIETSENTWKKYSWKYRLWKFFWGRFWLYFRKLKVLEKFNDRINKKYGGYINPEKRFMAGVACYGYDDPYDRYLTKLGLTDEQVRDMNGGESGSCYTSGRWKEQDGKKVYFNTLGITVFTEESGPKEFEVEVTKEELAEVEAHWVGVTKEVFDSFTSWLKEVLEDQCYPGREKILEKVKDSTAMQYNQGDAYFANALGRKIPGYAIGKAETPVLETLLKGVVDENRD